MTAASTGGSKAGGYARYLESKTLAPELGDYYLDPATLDHPLNQIRHRGPLGYFRGLTGRTHLSPKRARDRTHCDLGIGIGR